MCHNYLFNEKFACCLLETLYVTKYKNECLCVYMQFINVIAIIDCHFNQKR